MCSSLLAAARVLDGQVDRYKAMPFFNEPGRVPTWTRSNFEDTMWSTGDKGRQKALASSQPAGLKWSLQSLITFVVVIGRELHLDVSGIH